MSEKGSCAHTVVHWTQCVAANGLTTDRWACPLCGTEFVSRAQLDKARADLENERAMRAGEHDDTHSRIEKLHAELDEARAELAKVKVERDDLRAEYIRLVGIAHDAIDERDALRAAVEKRNLRWQHASPQLREEMLIPLPPSAAPAASEPSEVRPCPDCWGAGVTVVPNLDTIPCAYCGGTGSVVQQSPAQPEEGK